MLQQLKPYLYFLVFIWLYCSASIALWANSIALFASCRILEPISSFVFDQTHSQLYIWSLQRINALLQKSCSLLAAFSMILVCHSLFVCTLTLFLLTGTGGKICFFLDEVNLDGGADEDEEEVGGGKAGEECVGRRLEGALLHHRQDDQQVAQHSECKDHPGDEQIRPVGAN